MKIHLNQIPLGRTLHLEGEEQGDILDLHDALVRALSPVRYALDVGISEGGLFATGSVEADLELECVRCLTKFPYTVRVPGFAAQVELGTSQFVDLTEEIREDILLALPPHPNCDWDGGKACVGVRETTTATSTTTEAAGANEAAAGPKAGEGEEKNPWAGLDALTKPKKG